MKKTKVEIDVFQGKSVFSTKLNSLAYNLLKEEEVSFLKRVNKFLNSGNNQTEKLERDLV